VLRKDFDLDIIIESWYWYSYSYVKLYKKGLWVAQLRLLRNESLSLFSPMDKHRCQGQEVYTAIKQVTLLSSSQMT